MKLYQALASIFAGILLYLTQAVSVSLIVLIGLMIIDYLTGLTAAGLGGKLSSRIGIKGIIKKVGMLLLVFICMLVDYLLITEITFVDMSALGLKGTISFVLCCWYIGNELISITENLIVLEVPIPAFIKKAFAKFKEVVEPETQEE